MQNINVKPRHLSAVLEHYELLEHYDKMTTVKEARDNWRRYREEHGLAGSPKILTYPENQHKLKKSEAYTVGLTLQSADGAGVETCPWRGQCAAVCVLKNGNGRFNHVQEARNVKTKFLQSFPISFMRLLVEELDVLARAQQGYVNRYEEWQQLRCRMNVNSDLRWYKIAPWLFKRYEESILFYDYTKNPAVLSTTEKGLVAENYLLVYSYNEQSRAGGTLDSFLDDGGKVAVVTNRKKGQPVMQWADRGTLVVDGDVTDDLWSHPEGSIIDLTAKGQARTKGGNFVQHIY